MRSSRSRSLPRDQPLRWGPMVLRWTLEQKMALSAGRTEAAVPSGRRWPGLGVGGGAPEEEWAGSTGEAQPELLKPHGGEARARDPSWRTPRAAACGWRRRRGASEVPAAPVAWLPSVPLALPGWALGLPQRAGVPLYTLPGSAAGWGPSSPRCDTPPPGGSAGVQQPGRCWTRSAGP